MNAPETFFIYVQDSNLMTQHNLQFTNSMVSSGISNAFFDEGSMKKYLDGTMDFLPLQLNSAAVQSPSVYVMNKFLSGYMLEHNAEMCRKKVNPLLPSRLSAIYAFSDIESCEQVSNKYGWRKENIRKFKLLPNPLNRVHKVNMEIVSLMRYAYKNASFENDQDIWAHYWLGKGDLTLDLPSVQGERQTINSGVIWEYLIEGRLELLKEKGN